MSNPVLFEPYATWIHNFVCDTRKSQMMHVLLAVCFGILLSPWSYGLFFLLCYTIVYETLYYIFTKGDERYYNLFTRTGVIYGYIFGYILGRSFSNCDILYEGVPCFKT